MNRPDAIRGQPLLVLAAILGAWLAVRVLLWAPPFPVRPPLPPPLAPHLQAEAVALEIALPRERGTALPPDFARRSPRALRSPDIGSSPAAPRPSQDARLTGAAPSAGALPSPAARREEGYPAIVAPSFVRSNRLKELGQATAGPGTPSLSGLASQRPAPVDMPLAGTSAGAWHTPGRRFTGDAWLLWRADPSTAVLPGVSAYGRSQAGAVLRYALLPNHVLLPAIYARVSRTAQGPRQKELAAGLSLRPLAKVPVHLAVEARVTETASGREVRPAAFAVTRLPPVALPLELRGEAYLQAGYAGGRLRTAFADGQGRIDRRLVRLGGDQELRAGLGIWGGAQKGASRLDVGPSASMALAIGGAFSRITVDYRLRVAGDAAPSSGPAVTFSAGF